MNGASTRQSLWIALGGLVVGILGVGWDRVWHSRHVRPLTMAPIYLGYNASTPIHPGRSAPGSEILSAEPSRLGHLANGGQGRHVRSL